MIPFTVTAHYPFLLHDADYDGSLKWPLPDEHGVIHAYECKKFLKIIIVGTNLCLDCVDTTPSSSCVECLKLDPSQDLSGLSAPAKHLRQI